ARLIHQLIGNKGDRKSFRAVEDCVAKMGNSPLEWLDALPVFEQSIKTLVDSARSAVEPSEELQWWISELKVRLAELEKLKGEFPPWGNTKFRSLPGISGEQ